ncbi:MAG: saccharopine dehydrogenase NADP-binding domain-containing protein, partial [Bacteroidales bacterium]|nr:saccharopine dehydrogenase NADP-binding domain-containing protein [Bacteroidales bacterium]
MKNILVIGAGLSASTLIKYLLDHSEQHSWKITIGDKNFDAALKKIAGHPNGTPIHFDVFDRTQCWDEVGKSDLVVSMLPASMHALVASDCVKQGKPMVTASYISNEIKALDEDAKKAGVLLLNEIGVDPGIDHMSAMRIIDRLKAEGIVLQSFRSFCGGLVAPKYDNNPWNYKFTWAPRNVVLAGQGTAQFIINGQYKYIPYHKLFSRIQRVNVLDYGEFESYMNRDSLKYRSIYGLDKIPTMVRGTLRRPGYAKSWNSFVQMGMTDDSYTLENSENMTYAEFTETFLRFHPELSLEKNVAQYLELDDDSMPMYRLRWLGLFDNKTKIGLKNASPAQILQDLLQKKWAFGNEDRDMIVMQHQFGFIENEDKRKIVSSMVV